MKIVDYDDLVAREPATIASLARHLGAKPEWIEIALKLLSDIHDAQPHHTDLKFKALKTDWYNQVEDEELKALRAEIVEEAEFYQQWKHASPAR